MPDGGPFANIFNPDNPQGNPLGAGLGMIGNMLGIPNQKEREDAATSQIVQQLSDRVQQGASPQQAITGYLATPEGAQQFAKAGGKTLMTAIAQFKQTVDQTAQVGQVAPGYTPVTVTPGSKTPQFGEQTPTTEQGTARTIPPTNLQPPGYGLNQLNPQSQRYEPVRTQPTLPAQDFDTFTKLSQIPPQMIQDFARLQAMPPDQRDTELRRVLKQAVSEKILTDKDAVYLQSGVFGPQGAIRIQNKVNSHGDTIGYVIHDFIGNRSIDYDAGTGQTNTTPIGGPAVQPPLRGAPGVPAGTPAPVRTPGLAAPPPAMPAQPGSLDAGTQPQPVQQPSPSPYSDKRTMFFGSGPAAAAFSTLGTLGRSISTQLNIPGTEEASANQRNIEALQFAVARMTKEGQGLNIPSKYISLAENLSPSTGIFSSDPKTALNTSIDLHGRLTQAWYEDEAIRRDTRLGNEQRKRAESRQEVYQNVIQSLPTLKEMLDLRDDINKNGPLTKTNEVTPGRLLEGVRTGVTGATDTTKRTYEDVTKGGPTAPAAENRFGSMDDERLLAVDPKRLNPQDAVQFRDELRRRQQKMAPKK